MSRAELTDTIEIVNWDEYQRGRKRSYKHHWFSLSNTLPDDPKLFHFTVEEKWLWVCLLCYVSWEGSHPTEINLSYLAHRWGTPALVIQNALSKFENTGLIRYLTKHASTCAPISGPHSTVQDSTIESTEIVDTPPSSKKTKKDKQTSEEITSLWNEIVKGTPLPSLRSCSIRRRRLATIRWRENPSKEFWREVICRILDSPFCCGQNNRGWRANIDFLLRPDTATKVLEGQYDNRSPGSNDLKFERN